MPNAYSSSEKRKGYVELATTKNFFHGGPAGRSKGITVVFTAIPIPARIFTYLPTSICYQLCPYLPMCEIQFLQHSLIQTIFLE